MKTVMVCANCSLALHNEPGPRGEVTFVDSTGGDVCGVRSGPPNLNRDHVPICPECGDGKYITADEDGIYCAMCDGEDDVLTTREQRERLPEPAWSDHTLAHELERAQRPGVPADWRDRLTAELARRRARPLGAK